MVRNILTFTLKLGRTVYKYALGMNYASRAQNVQNNE